MKSLKMLFIGLIIGVIISTTSTVTAATREITVKLVEVGLKIDGKNSVYRPVVINGISYLPVRIIGEYFGLDIDWDSENRVVNVTKPESE